MQKDFLLENKFVDDAVALIKKICIEDRDIETFARLVKLMDKLYHGKPPLSFDDVDGDELLMAFEESKDTGKGQVVYNGGVAEYYQNGKLVFPLRIIMRLLSKTRQQDSSCRKISRRAHWNFF